MSQAAEHQENEGAEATSVMEKIIDQARWAPSGDNVQPWHFEIKSERKLVVHIPEIEKNNPYEFDHGRPTYLSVGMMLECMRMAAASQGLSMHWKLQGDETWDGREQKIDVNFRKLKKSVPDDLLDYVPLRSVNRFSYQNKKNNRPC